jgi:hypothetical protein
MLRNGLELARPLPGEKKDREEPEASLLSLGLREPDAMMVGDELWYAAQQQPTGQISGAQDTEWE